MKQSWKYYLADFFTFGGFWLVGFASAFNYFWCGLISLVVGVIAQNVMLETYKKIGEK